MSKKNESLHPPAKRVAGVDHHSARLTEAKVRQIRRDYERSKTRYRENSIRGLAFKYGVSPVAIWKVVNRKSWRHVK
mgnify:CR=1 FL=1|jgi:hypothetical protein